jgi:hypothetical protein
MEKAELKPALRGYFWMLTADRQCELLTAAARPAVTSAL